MKHLLQTHLLHKLKENRHLMLGIAFLFALTIYSPLTVHAESSFFDRNYDNFDPYVGDYFGMISDFSSSIQIEADNSSYGVDWSKPVEEIYYYYHQYANFTWYTNSNKTSVYYYTTRNNFYRDTFKNTNGDFYYFAPAISQYDDIYFLYKYDPKTETGVRTKIPSEKDIFDFEYYDYVSPSEKDIRLFSPRKTSGYFEKIYSASRFGVIFNENSADKYDSYEIVQFQGTNLPVFSSQLAAYNFFTTGDKDGLLNESTAQNKDIGYLEGLDFDKKYVYQGQDMPSEIYESFTWKDTHDYDDTYKVEVSYRIRAQTRPYGIFSGPVTRPIMDYMSEFYLLEPCKYNDLKYEIEYMKDIAPTVKEYTDTLPSFGFTKATSIQYCFRIYYHNEKSGVKYYGPYAIYRNKSDNLFSGEIGNNEFVYGDYDSDGNIVIDENKPPIFIGRPNIGSGNSKEEAEEDLNNSKDPNKPTDPNNPNSGDSSFPEWNGEFSWEYITQIFDWIFNSIKNFFLAMGQFPSFISAVFPFLPDAVSSFIASALLIAIMLRILGR